MKYVFDLKGTTYKRYTIPVKHRKRILKDKNFQLMNQNQQVNIYIYIYLSIPIIIKYLANKYGGKIRGIISKANNGRYI